MLRHFFIRSFSSLPSSFLLISEKGEKLGHYSVQTAAQCYNSQTHQLITVRQDPPVVKILPIAKPIIEKVIPKKLKEKQVKIGPNIADHDLSLKHDQLLRFLEKGYLVKLHTPKPLSPELAKYVIQKKMERKCMADFDRHPLALLSIADQVCRRQSQSPLCGLLLGKEDFEMAIPIPFPPSAAAIQDRLALYQAISTEKELQGWYLVVPDKQPTVDHVRMHQLFLTLGVDRLLLYSDLNLFHIHGSHYSPLELNVRSFDAERIAVQHVAMNAKVSSTKIRSQRNAAQMLLDRINQVLLYLKSPNPSPAILRDIQSLCYRLEDPTHLSTLQVDLEMLLAALTHAIDTREEKRMK